MIKYFYRMFNAMNYRFFVNDQNMLTDKNVIIKRSTNFGICTLNDKIYISKRILIVHKNTF